ncbi:hypothetical protein KRX57_04085 [Weeksellaceae bacterium TAE3-ERU29]|nr:hypothetical protein [Weeksellaceae bacterium TAE3-ERU29]
MQYTKRLILSMILLFTAMISFAQTHAIDDTLNQIDNLDTEGKTEQVKNQLSELERQSQANNNQVDLAKIYMMYSKVYTRKNDFTKGKKYADLSLEIAEKSKSPLALAYAYYSYAFYYHFLDIKDLCSEYTNKALEILPKNKDPKLEILLYYRLYGLYSNWDNLELTEKYANKVIDLAKKHKEYDLLANGYSAKSTVMRIYHKETEKGQYRDSVLNYLMKANKIAQKYPNQVYKRTQAILTTNLTNLYYEKWNSNHSDEFKDSIQKYLNITEKTLKNVYNKGEILANIKGISSELALNEGNTIEAENLLQTAYNELQSEKSPPFYTMTNISEGLSRLYKNKGDYRNAYLYKEKKESYKDSIYKQNQMEQTVRLEAIYQNKQIKKELELIKETANQRKISNYLLVVAVLFLIGLLFFIVRNFKNKSNLQKEKAHRLQMEKEEAQMRIKFEQEEQRRLRTEQELLKVKNQQIEKEVLAHSLQIERKNELLEKLDNGENQTVKQILKEEKRIDKSLNKNLNEFKKVNPKFFERIDELSEGKLTNLDKKYCAYLYLKLSNKEIATIFNVEPKSVRMTKYRIKQKLNLDKATDLEEFLHNLLV